MELTQKQTEGLEIAINRYKKGEKYTIISGYAGTGKSTLVRFIVNALGANKDDVVYAAYTGKAAEVLRKKGNPNAMTLHKLLYKNIPKKDGSFLRIPKAELEYSIVVVDEISMMPKPMMELLFRHKDVYIIGLGDPYQLPPIKKTEDNELLYSPHIFLDEIMRQEAESEIIRLSLSIRENQPIENKKGKEVQVISAEELNKGMLQWADQVITATNASRNWFNNEIRKLNGKTKPFENNDKVICLRNYWEDLSTEENPLVNGTIGFVENLREEFLHFPGVGYKEVFRADIETEEGERYKNILIDKQYLLTGKKTLSSKDEFFYGKNPKLKKLIPKEFAFGYAITCHKAQGSEYEKILVLEEGFPYEKEEHSRWLYTACTRATSRLVLVR